MSPSYHRPLPPLPPTSHPTNPEMVSLLTLPAEIRYNIYESLFTQPRPIKMREPHSPRSFARIDGLALLKTCRQINHEGTGVLLSSNRFQFSEKNSRDDVNPFMTVTQWLSSYFGLGRNAHHVRHILIDCSTPWWDDGLDLSSLLHEAWKPSMSKLKVEFNALESLDRLFWKEYGVRRFQYSTRHSSDFEIEFLQPLWDILIKDEVFGLKKYSRFDSGSNRLLDRVWVDPIAQEVKVEFWSTNWDEKRVVNSWWVSSEAGNEIERTDSSLQPKTIKDLLDSNTISRKLMGLLVPSKEEVVLDFTAGTVDPPIPGVLHISQLFRKAAWEVFACKGFYKNNFIAKFVTHDRNASFGAALAALQRWPWYDVPGDERVIEPKVLLLRFELAEDENVNSLDDIRINFKDIIQGIPATVEDLRIRTELTCHSLPGDSSNEMNFGEICRKLILPLLKLCIESKEYRHMGCDAVWVDGYGKPQSVELVAGADGQIIQLDISKPVEDDFFIPSRPQFLDTKRSSLLEFTYGLTYFATDSS